MISTADIIRRMLAPAALGLAVAACGGGGDTNPALGDVNGTGMTSKVFVRGAVTGFGSVRVGERRFVTDDANFVIRDAGGSEEALRVGQIVEVEATRDDDGTLRAQTVRYDATISGPVSAVDSVAETLTVAGQRVRVVPATVLDGLALTDISVGDRLEVSGRRTVGEGVAASYIGRDDDRDEVEVVGRVAGLDEGAQSFRIGELSVGYSAAELDIDDDGALMDGLLVEVEGSLESGVLIADEVDEENDDAFRDFLDEDNTEVELEGSIDEVIDASSFLLRGVTVRFDGRTEFDDGGPQNIAVDAAVEVEGIVIGDGTLLASEISFDDDFGSDRDDDAGSVELTGPVQSADDTGIDIFGVRVAVDASARLSDDRDDDRRFELGDLAQGDYVEIAAREPADGGNPLRAVRVEREDDDGDDDKIDGIVRSFDEAAGTLDVSGVQVQVDGNTAFDDSDAASFFASLGVGDRVEVDGRYEGVTADTFHATEIERDDDDDSDEDSDDDTDDDTDDDSED